MPETDDRQLLQTYVASGSSHAFEQLVRRHINLVYSSALRQTGGNSAMADDVTQGVFIVLTQKARSISDAAMLPGWLIRTTRYAVLNARKFENRRTFHEQKAAAMAPTFTNSSSTDPSSTPDEIAPVLDEALAHLRDKDRTAVVLRYLQGQPTSAVATALGVSTEAAEKRITRATTKLREIFTRRGIHTAADALENRLSSQAMCAAPPALIAGVLASHTAPLVGATSSVAISKGILHMIHLAQLKAVATVGAVVLLTGTAATVAVVRPPALFAAAAPSTQPAAVAVSRAPAFGAQPKPKDPQSDPMKRMLRADDLAKQKKYQAALDEYLWCFDHGLESDSSFVGVRLTFLLNRITDLQTNYPPASEALPTRCDAAKAALLAGSSNTTKAQDFIYLARKLNRADELLPLFDQLKSMGPSTLKTRKVFGALILPDFVAAKRYADALEVSPDPLAQLKRNADTLEMLRKHNARSGSGSPEIAQVRTHMIAGSADLYECLLGTSKTADARKLAEAILAMDDSRPTFDVLIARAKRAGSASEADHLSLQASQSQPQL